MLGTLTMKQKKNTLGTDIQLTNIIADAFLRDDMNEQRTAHPIEDLMIQNAKRPTVSPLQAEP